MRKASMIWIVAILVTVLGGLPVFAQADVVAALDYLTTQQNAGLPGWNWGQVGQRAALAAARRQ